MKRSSLRLSLPLSLKWRWLFLALALHGVAAWFSKGYQNSDEQFQILEFLNAFIGKTPISSLPIEYGRMIRPWFQPFLYWIPLQALRSVGIESPFAWAFAIRLVSGVIGWVSLLALAECIPLWVRERGYQKLALIFLALTWYLPAFHVRHSSENLSGALFVIGLCGIVISGRLGAEDATRKNAPPLLSLWGGGLLWGLAFEARYQVGFVVAGGFFWMAFIAKLRARELVCLASGILFAIALGVVLDRIGYGSWVFAPWNYFRLNLIEGYASATDTSPWWDYFRRIWTEAWPILGFLSLVGMIIFWILRPKHPLTWSHLPLFAVHVALAHKETRFLFPLAHAVPICLVVVLESLKLPRWGAPRGGQGELKGLLALRFLGGAVIAMNGAALLAFTLLPAAPTMRFYESVYQLAREGRLTGLKFREWDPYAIGGIPMYFYRPPGLQPQALGMVGVEGSEFYLAEPWPRCDSDLASRCAPVTRSLPDWGLLSRLHNWTLYRCQATQPPRKNR